jgi:hypothetical protein
MVSLLANLCIDCSTQRPRIAPIMDNVLPIAHSKCMSKCMELVDLKVVHRGRA